MNEPGIWISELRIIGPDKPPAAITFQNGPNVVSGASDTGKSYILQCINYMLGGKDPPKSVTEDAGYDTALLEIAWGENERGVLRRSLKAGGDFQLYATTLANWQESTPSKTLQAQHSRSSNETVSALLLGLTGLSSVVIYGKAGKTRPMTFRDVCRFAIISETEIIAEHTPVLASGQRDTQREDKSTFSFLISGEDVSGVVVGPDIKMRKAGWHAKVEMLDQMIADLNTQLDALGNEDVQQLVSVESSIQAAVTLIAADNATIEGLTKRRREAWEAVQNGRSRLAAIGQLTERFTLLQDHYTSDRERLQFVSEADHYLSQMGDAHCPVCGSVLAGHDAERLREDHDALQTIQQASRVESGKLVLQLRDLEGTLGTLQAERRQIETTLVEQRDVLAENERMLRNELQPRLAASNQELSQLLEVRQRLQVAGSLRRRAEELKEKRRLIGPEPKQKRGSTIAPTTSETSGRRAFCDGVEAILKAWRYPAPGTVEFNEKMDLVVAGVARKSHGKGVRAILQSSFTIGLMQHALGRHPHFVILDSPLTSYKGKDKYEASKDVQRGFFEYLVGSPEVGQIIVLENVDPPADLQTKIKFEHFSGPQGANRRGFYPV